MNAPYAEAIYALAMRNNGELSIDISEIPTGPFNIYIRSNDQGSLFFVVVPETEPVH
jgi:hypothetical protein